MTKRAVIITSSIIIGLVTILAVLFGVVFRVKNIKVVSGEDFKYQAQINEILTTSKLKKNTSIFSVERAKVANNIESKFPFARVQVNISGFNKVKIAVSNRTPLYYFVQENIYYILDEECKILEILDEHNFSTSGYDLILLNNVFSASESTKAGQFLSNKYSKICDNLYDSLYSNAMISVDLGQGVEDKYLSREDMCDVIDSIKFSQSIELNGKMDKLHLITSYGVEITIIEPQHNLDYKINMAFSALRTLQAEDESLLQRGFINVKYSYSGTTQTTICEYRAD